MFVQRFVTTAFVLLLPVAAANAQIDTSNWGVAVAAVPSWGITAGSSPIAKLAEAVHEGGDLGLDIQGSDFRIGVTRGRYLGGDWGVSFVRRTFDDDSTQGGIEQSCQDIPDFSGQPMTQCFTFGEEFLYRGVTLRGLEANKFFAVGTISQRVQIGVDLAGGFGTLKGAAVRRQVHTVTDTVVDGEGRFIGLEQRDEETIEPVDARDLVPLDPTLLGRVELAAAVILMPDVKVRVSGGFNYPGTHTFSVTGLYFFGRR